MELFTYVGVGLVALLVMMLPALAFKQHWNVIREDWRYPLRLAFGILAEDLGVTITYLSKFGNTNTTTAPTAIEANFLPIQTAQVFVADTDTEVQLVHNWGGLLGPSFASFGFPFVGINKLLGTGNSFRTDWTIGLANSNKVFLTKPAGTGTGGTFLVTLFLPHSLIGGAR
jgi:hypothetical protein